MGLIEITEKDVELRDKVVRIYYPQHKTPDAGLIQLKNAFTFAAILDQNGHKINDHILRNETDRIDASTKDPATLEKIKSML